MERVLFTSASAASRIERAHDHLARALAAGRRVTLIAPSREAGRELVRRDAIARGASSRIEPTTLAELALSIARPSLLRRDETFVSGAGLDAIVAEAIASTASLGRYEAVRDRPGTPRAIAATLEELMLADLAPDALLGIDPPLAALASRTASLLATRRLVPFATVLTRATQALRAEASPLTDVIFLDVALPSSLEVDLARTLVRAAKDATITLPHGDTRTRSRWTDGLDLADEHDDEGARSARALFSDAPQGASEAHAVEVRSGTTEAEECLELARVILDELDRSPPTALDRIAIAVRDVERYRVPISEALTRAGIPFHLERAARRPDPAGRAFLSLLECAAEGLSARAFADYLAFGVLPEVDERGAPVVSPERGEAAERAVEDDEDATDDTKKKRAVIGGALRAPRRWERLLVDAAVIGGDPSRWSRRLKGLAAELRDAIDHAEDREGPEAKRASQRLADLERLTGFALPLIERLATLPARARWSVLVPHLEELARAALLDPRRVLEVLSQLSPLAGHDEADAQLTLDEVRRVLLPRLFEITTSPPDRGGVVRVLAADAIAGRAFELVLVPGLVERSFPRRILEDPILNDDARARIAPRASDTVDGSTRSPLATSDDRADDERMLLRRLAHAAPRLVVSHPRRDERNRARVPSLYLLELVRADRGRLVTSSELEREGRGRDLASGWGVPRQLERALDLREADLATIAALVGSGASDTRGHAHFLVASSPVLRRTLLARHNAHGAKWVSQDGLVTKDPAVLALLAKERPGARVFSATALESFAACPYRFYLRTIVRLKARESLEPIETLDPMTRGSLIHAIQFALVTEARDEGIAIHENEPALRALLDAHVKAVADAARDRLAPAIDRVFSDEIAAIEKDLRAWLHHLVSERTFTPALAELGFGEPGGAQHDPASVDEPIAISVPRAEGEGEISLRLRGSIDLVERGEGTLRATDYKTGRAEAKAGARVSGGTSLQPLLYALVLESMLANEQLTFGDTPPRVVGGRLWYCTSRGEDRRVDIALDDEGRRAIGEVATVIDRSVERGFFPRAPGDKGCAYCDYVAICGPDAALRADRKDEDRRMDGLVTLRGRA
ncbi:MAG: PD-(D/E)XK nuclease family protein [Deltaproteobacteria bacterium]|nr:PD-(D/E)XK nuclease family protein [Deltaproteobacteria bacterium]